MNLTYWGLSSNDHGTVNTRNGDWRKQEDGYYKAKPKDETYFKKSYLEKTEA